LRFSLTFLAQESLAAHHSDKVAVFSDRGRAKQVRPKLMKVPPKRLSDLKGGSPAVGVYAPPTPKVSRQKKAKVLSAAERAAFLASRPDLKA